METKEDVSLLQIFEREGATGKCALYRINSPLLVLVSCGQTLRDYASATKDRKLLMFYLPHGTNRMQDWGKTNYRIVRNWATPGNKSTNLKTADAEQPAMNSKVTSNAEQFVTKSSHTISSTTKGSTRGEQAAVKSETSYNYRLRRSTSGRGHNTTWFVPDAYSTSKKGPRRTSISDGSDGETDNRLLDAGCICEQGHIHSSSMSVSESFSHLQFLSHHQDSKTSTCTKQVLSSDSEKEQAPFPGRNIEHTGEMERESFVQPVRGRDTDCGDENDGQEVIRPTQRRKTRSNGDSLSQPVRRRNTARSRKSGEQVPELVSRKKSEIEGERVIVGKKKTNVSMVLKKQSEDSGGVDGGESGMKVVVEAAGNEQLGSGNRVSHDDGDMDVHHLSASETFPG